MSEDQFTKLFTYIEAFRADVDRQFEAEHREHADIRDAIAELSAQVRDYHHEMIFLSHHVDKLRDAILQIAAETGVKLKVEL
jgi:uncharacterized coiled-coil DUF342 family protein